MLTECNVLRSELVLNKLKFGYQGQKPDSNGG